MQMEVYIMVFGEMDSHMEKELKHGVTGLYMKEIGKKVKCRDKV